MRVSYYPGCSLEATARDYRESLEYVCRRLGIELAEIDDWSCCGATAAHSTELIGVAWQAPEAGSWLNRHLVNPSPLLRKKLLM
jgi:heterodisulfide reductase subunit B